MGGEGGVGRFFGDAEALAQVAEYGDEAAHVGLCLGVCCWGWSALMVGKSPFGGFVGGVSEKI